SADDGYKDPSATFRCSFDTRADIFRSLDSSRRQFKRPCNHQRDWKSDRDECDHQTHNPVWNFQEWKNLRGDLDQQPTDDRIRDGNFVNVAPLQFRKERSLFAHGGGKFIFATNVLLRVTSRNLCYNVSTRRASI